jgi:DNA (cytosine-5)-methyltransferase 1
MDVTHEVTGTLRAEAHHPPLVMEAAGFCTEHSHKSRSIGYEEELSPTLRAGVVPATVALDHHPADSRLTISEEDKIQTLTSRMGTGGNNIPLIMRSFGISSKDSNGMKSNNPNVGFYETDTARTIDANGGNPTCNQGGTAVVGCPVYSVTTGSFAQVSEDMAPTVLARDYKDPTTVCYGIGRDTFNHSKSSPFAPTFVEEVQPTLVAKGPGAVQRGYTVRRLTPTECARLQGFPDWWCSDLGTSEPTEEDISIWTEVWETHRRIVSPDTKPKTRNQIIKWIKDPYSDAAEYKMWGNGVALPCVYFVLAGIAYVQKCEVESA